MAKHSIQMLHCVEHLFGDKMTEMVEEELRTRELELAPDGTLIVDGAHVVDCLGGDVEKTRSYAIQRKHKLAEAREILSPLVPFLPDGAVVDLFGTRFTKSEKTFYYGEPSIMRKGAISPV